MSATKFVRAEELWREIDACPLATGQPATDRRACAACRYNAAFAGVARIGCVIHTPADVVARAQADLRARTPALSARLERLLRQHQQVHGGRQSRPARQWLDVATTWFEEAQRLPAAQAEQEVAMVIARFAHAALERGEAVLILS